MPVQSVREAVRHARSRSPYYALLYDGLPPDVDDLLALPVVDHASFWTANSLAQNDVLTAPLTEALVLKSGGTTGSPKFSCYTREEWREFVTAYGRGMVDAGLQPGHRVVNTFYAGELYASFLFTHTSLWHAPVDNVRLPVSGSASPQYVAATMKEFGAHVIVGTPTKMAQVAEHLVAEERTLPQVELLLFAGEMFFDDQRPLLAGAFPNADVRSLGCASVDAGLLGSPVPGDDPLVHRAYHPETVVEILDEATDEPVTKPGVPGRLVVTALTRRLMPIIRYPVGDRAEWTDGERGEFRLLGRSGEGARVGTVTMYTADVRQLVATADPSGHVAGVQLVTRRREGRDELVLRLATARPDAVPAELTDALVRSVAAARPEFAASVNAGVLHPLAVEWTRHSGLVVSPRSGKLVPVVDERLDR